MDWYENLKLLIGVGVFVMVFIWLYIGFNWD